MKAKLSAGTSKQAQEGRRKAHWSCQVRETLQYADPFQQRQSTKAGQANTAPRKTQNILLNNWVLRSAARALGGSWWCLVPGPH